jgi:HYR domain
MKSNKTPILCLSGISFFPIPLRRDSYCATWNLLRVLPLLCCGLLGTWAAQAQNYTITTSMTTIVITDVSGNSEVLDISENGGNIRFDVAGRTYSLNGGGAAAFPVSIALSGITSITANTANGNDEINIGTFTANLPNLTINGGIGDDAVNFNGDITFASNANLDLDLQNDNATPGMDNVTVAINANLALSGTGAATIKVSKNVLIDTGGSIVTDNGNLTVEANQQPVSTIGSFIGVEVRGVGSLLQSTGTGLLTVKGTGGVSSGFNQYGIFVSAGGKINGGSGIVTVVGNGGIAAIGNANYGVFISGIDSKITSLGGDVDVTGTGNNLGASGVNYGVSVESAGQITAGGNGTVTVIGKGGIETTAFNNYGVHVDGIDSKITSSGGNVSVTGTGSIMTTSERNYGIYITSGGQITAGSSGTVTVVGNAGIASVIGANADFGVYIVGPNAQIASSGGNVNVTGSGSGTGEISSGRFGVYIADAGQITAGGNGTVTVAVTVNGVAAPIGVLNAGIYVSGIDSRITSNGGNVKVTGIGDGMGASILNYGIIVTNAGQITAGGNGSVTVGDGGNIVTGIANVTVYIDGSNSKITSSGGNVDVTGTGGGSITGNGNYGIVVTSAGQITAGGSGIVTVVGNGGTTSGIGVYINGVDSKITSSGGNITVTGVEGGGPNSIGFVSASDGLVTTIPNGGNITLIANSMSIGALGVSTPIGNSVTLRPFTNGVQIDLGDITDPTSGPLGLSDEELDNISTGTLHIGDANTGNITVSADISRPASTVINLTTGGAVNFNASALNSASGNVNISAEGGVNPTVVGTDINAGNLTFTNGTNLRILVNGAAPGNGTAATYTQLTVLGTVNLAGVGLVRSGSYVVASCQIYTIVDNDGTDAIIGTFTGLAQGATTNLLGIPAMISYVGGTGNDVTLTTLGMDNLPPTITCPANLTVGTAPNRCDANVTYTTPSASDNCGLAPGSPSLQSGPASGGLFLKGQTTVVWRATDLTGLTRTCSFRVTVKDTEAPTLICPAVVNINTTPNLCSGVATYTNPTFTDNCAPTTGTSTRISGLISGSNFPVGNSNVVFQATDAAGNTRRCTMVVTVMDNQPPALICPQPIVVTGSGTPCTSTVIYANATATDNCAGTLTPFLFTGLASGSVFPAGVTTNTFRAVAPNGQIAACSFTVTVNCGSSKSNTGLDDRDKDLDVQGTLTHKTNLGLTIAPNPAVSFVTMGIEGVDANGGTLLVFDQIGRLVQQQVIASEQRTTTLQVAEFAPGLYRVVLRTDYGTVTKILAVVKE